MIYTDTKELIRRTKEIVFDDEETGSKVLDKIDRNIKHKFLSFFFKGVDFRLMIKGSILAAIFFVLFMLLRICQTTVYSKWDIIAFIVFSLISAVIVSPLLDSISHSLNEIKEKDVESLTQEIKRNEFSFGKLHVIADNVTIAESNLNIKLRIARGMIALLWAIYVYVLTDLFLPVFLKSGAEKKNVIAVVEFFIILFLFYLIERCYSRSVRRIYLTLKIALNEVLAEKPE